MNAKFSKIQSYVYGALVLFILTIAGKCDDSPVVEPPSETNSPPTALAISADSISENEPVGSLIGTFSSTDADSEAFTYSFQEGDGSSDNANFSISGDSLKSNISFDFEGQASHSIRVQTDDGNGGTFQMVFTITVSNTNENPISIALSANSISENEPIGSFIGTFNSTDVDSEAFTYSFQEGDGADDNANFSISGDSLKSNIRFDFESQASHSIRVQTDDGNGGTFQMVFTITVLDVPNLSIKNSVFSISEFSAIGDTAGQVVATDDLDIASYALFSGNVGGAFSLSNSGYLLVSNALDYETLALYDLGVAVFDPNGNRFETSISIMVRDSFQLLSVDDVSDNADLELDGASGLSTAVVGGTTYLFVTGYNDDGVSVFSVASDGTLTSVDDVSDNATLELDGAADVSTAVIGGTTYLFVTGYDDDGVSVFSVAADGTLTSVDDVSDNADLELDGASGLSTAVVGGTTYLFVTGELDDGVSVFSVAADGTLTSVDTVSDNAALELDGAIGLSTAVVGGNTYLFVAGRNDDGVSVFSITSDGTLTSVDDVSDDADLELDGAFAVSTAVVGGSTYLFVAGNIDDGFSVFSVAADGTLTSVDDVSDDADLELNGAYSVSTAVVGESTYLFVAGFSDNGVSVFSVASDGTLTSIYNVSDNATLELDGIADVSTAVIEGNTYLFVAGFNDDGVSVFRVID